MQTPRVWQATEIDLQIFHRFLQTIAVFTLSLPSANGSFEVGVDCPALGWRNRYQTLVALVACLGVVLHLDV
jgi:hypothetical protein